jgi:hypothetical protein
MGWACGMNGGGVLIQYWSENQKERDHWEDQDVGGCLLLRWILERKDGWYG